VAPPFCKVERPWRADGASGRLNVKIECVHDLQFKRPTFMGSQDRRKIVDIERDLVEDQYDARLCRPM